jgi:sec-independent protein translocase protein TatB
MEIFNVGPFEFLLILVIALIVLGPERMVNTAKQVGKLLHRFIQSPYWASIVRTTQEIRNIPRKIVQEAGLEESMEEFNRMRAQSFVEDLERNQHPQPSLSNPIDPKAADVEKNVILPDTDADAGNPGAAVETDSAPESD